MEYPDENDDLHLRSILEPDERIEVSARATDAVMVVSDRRLAVAAHDRLALDIPFDRLRRAQFDIERSRPATLVLVPEDPVDAPQVLAIPAEEYDAVGRALAYIGRRLMESP